ncbi:MAG: TatD family hydrolase, partial [Candidatus Moraniibacteriota bacterium]
MYDIHTHLYGESYDGDRDEVLLRAKKVGVEKMFVIGCTIEESKQSIALAEKHSEIFASIGLHPHFFNKLVEEEFSISNFQFSNKPQSFNEEIKKLIEELRNVAKSSNKVIAIGECGLDYFGYQSIVVSEEQKALQKKGFLAQIELAQELHLSLIIHCRPSIGTMDAYEDMFDILNNHASLIT